MKRRNEDETRFIGYYDYSMLLTYLSLLSAGAGIFLSLTGKANPYAGVICLLVSGLCDGFDGMVARTKKDRSSREKAFGIQVDSLADIVAFGALPACIGLSLLESSPVMQQYAPGSAVKWIVRAILLFYMLAALIRLAYFNVLEEERQKTEAGKLKYYTGLPVTSSCMIFPLIMFIRFLSGYDLAFVYYGAILLTGLAFIYRFKVKKPGLKEILILIGGAVVLVTAGLLLKKA